MSEFVTDEAVESAARALDENFNPDRYPVMAAMFSDYARTALEAAAPFIATQALQPIRDALANHPRCEEHPDGDVISCGWKAAVLDVQRALEARDG